VSRPAVTPTQLIGISCLSRFPTWIGNLYYRCSLLERTGIQQRGESSILKLFKDDRQRGNCWNTTITSGYISATMTGTWCWVKNTSVLQRVANASPVLLYMLHFACLCFIHNTSQRGVSSLNAEHTTALPQGGNCIILSDGALSSAPSVSSPNHVTHDRTLTRGYATTPSTARFGPWIASLLCKQCTFVLCTSFVPCSLGVMAHISNQTNAWD
jgi:hypothetical protein